MPPSEPVPTAEEVDPHGVRVHLDLILAERGMTLTELASKWASPWSTSAR